MLYLNACEIFSFAALVRSPRLRHAVVGETEIKEQNCSQRFYVCAPEIEILNANRINFAAMRCVFRKLSNRFGAHIVVGEHFRLELTAAMILVYRFLTICIRES